ncbi:MAG TPA: selenocysteine-specific translation elongation factor [Gemmatimonadaceae bacterium]|nr:selenocysteine-specific translation elongation factor [Gemmatimonadaceae bacterium]
MIIGTAGHIDHGKTTLVRALTGVDTDRLPEEKRRGITIELGFAPLALDGVGTVGVVDVPGHEAFVRTMLAGAAGIDVGLLVVAADDGVRPQTREHLAILDVLGIQGGVIALTKCDLVEDDWIALVEEDLRALVGGTPFSAAPIIRVSPGDEPALAALRAALARAALAAPARDADDLFRLPVDRVFTVRGTGTVVTGTAWSGSVSRDAEVRILPSGRIARTRAIQTHGAAVDRALPGQRIALALAGVDVADVHRGDVIVADRAWEASAVVRADASLLPDVPRPLGPRTAVRFHLGTTEVGARVVTAGGPLEPGQTKPVRLMLDAPVVARAGDRFVLRLASPVATIGGGVVTDPHAQRRCKPFAAPDLPPGPRLARLLVEAGAQGVALASLPVRLGVNPRGVPSLLREVSAVEAPGSDRALSPDVFASEGGRVQEFLDRFHRAHPLAFGASLQEVRSRLKVPPAFTEALVARGVANGSLEIEGAEIRRAGWAPTPTEAQRKTLNAMLQRLAEAGWEPPSVAELTAEFGAGAPDIIRLAERSGEVVQVDVERYYTASNLKQLLDKIGALMTPGKEVVPAEMRESLGLTRKYLIPLLEYCDRVGLTARRPAGRFWNGLNGVA